jgi:two-component system, NtrC family, response regulator AtoC
MGALPPGVGANWTRVGFAARRRVTLADGAMPYPATALRRGPARTARTIHERSPRAAAPMICLNCAALNETLLESELFGYERGAFTGATQAKQGLIEAANGGTVFLDEIGEMPASIQAKLLRVLEQREVQRLGALRPRPVDVRFIAATNRDLEEEVAAGRFREDLFFRINGISLTIPPLRERPDELEPLATLFVARAAEQLHRPRAPRITTQVLALMKRYAWPGNIRELRNVMERAVLLSSGDFIGLEHVPAEKWAPVAPVGARGSVQAMRAAIPASRPTMVDLEDAPTSTGMPAAPAATSERDRIVRALEACSGNPTHAAKMLGISRRTLITRIEEYGLPRPRKREDDRE